jgi:hypothetical protein
MSEEYDAAQDYEMARIDDEYILLENVMKKIATTKEINLLSMVAIFKEKYNKWSVGFQLNKEYLKELLKENYIISDLGMYFDNDDKKEWFSFQEDLCYNKFYEIITIDNGIEIIAKIETLSTHYTMNIILGVVDLGSYLLFKINKTLVCPSFYFDDELKISEDQVKGLFVIMHRSTPDIYYGNKFCQERVNDFFSKRLNFKIDFDVFPPGESFFKNYTCHYFSLS